MINKVTGVSLVFIAHKDTAVKRASARGGGAPALRLPAARSTRTSYPKTTRTCMTS